MTDTATNDAKPATKKKPFKARIRMYRHGLGDCFLLSFPKKGKGLTHVLIDCGIIGGTPNPSERMAKVAKDVAAESGGKLDVVVVTHEHWDHLSGFAQAEEVWRGVDFENVWLAWTEKREALTEELRRNILTRKVASLTKAVAKAKKDAAAAADALEKAEAEAKGGKKAKQLEASKKALDTFDKKAQGLAAVAGFFGEEGEDGKQLVKAFDFVKNRAKATQYLSPNDLVAVPGTPGVRVYVMGPPKSEAALRAEDPNEEEGYHKLALGAVEASVSEEEEFRAFDSRWGLPVNAPSKGESPGMQAMRAAYARDDWRKIDDGWAGAAERLALQMDQGTNNTSLVLAFELVDTREVLLFVGDAQAGNWRSWDKCNWTVDGRKESAEGLLQRTIFYKVGHHGSHNATMKGKGLERMPKLEAAFIPVDETVAHEVKGWVNMPLNGIRDALKKRCKVVFQGDVDVADKPGRWKSGEKIKQMEMNPKYKKGGKEPKVVEGAKTRSLYTDYFLK